MHHSSFALTLRSSLRISHTCDGHLLRSEADGTTLTLPLHDILDHALVQLQSGFATAQSLVASQAKERDPEALLQVKQVLRQLEERGWLSYGVPPLAIAEPMAECPPLRRDIPHWSQETVTLSRFAFQRIHEGSMVLESPLSHFRMVLLDWRACALLAQLARPQMLARLTPPPQIGPETAFRFLNLLWSTGFLCIKEESPDLRLWDFHNLLFHSRSRLGRHDYQTADITSSLAVWDRFPVVKHPIEGTIVQLPHINTGTVLQRDKTLTSVLEQRRSIREYDDERPITVKQLGEFLYRTGRVMDVYTEELSTEQKALLQAEFGEDFAWGEISRRPYPSGGAMYELEIYPVVRNCIGLNSGFYHYDPLGHKLSRLEVAEADFHALLESAHQSSGSQGIPQILFIITARFGRLFRKYRSIAYALILKHVGSLYQNFYLVATAMDLAPCALGAGDSDRFEKATGLDYCVESTVGEFMLGSLPAVHANNGRSHEDLGLYPISVPSLVPQNEVADQLCEPGTQGNTTISHVSCTFQDPLLSLHPHDLDDRLPGLADLRNKTLGDPRITIVILDGNPDYSLSCFAGAEVSKVFPFWHPATDPVPLASYLRWNAINNDESLDKDKRGKVLKSAFPEEILFRITGDSHACHVTSTIVGQEGSPSPGLAPRCRVINIPLNTFGGAEELMSPLNLARALELALELGANIIHCAICRPTKSAEGEEILVHALQKCLDQNILIIAPVGNDNGLCWCLPASLPGVLAVGALKPDGKPYSFSNWGGNYAFEGIIAPGGEILGAQPANEQPVRLVGTSMAAPVITGLSALLMSLQLQEGKLVDAEAIRAALLNTATPCSPGDSDKLERCLRGKVNLTGAMSVLFGHGVKLSFAGDRTSRQLHGVFSSDPKQSTDFPSVSPSFIPSATVAPSAAGLTTSTSSLTCLSPSTAHSGMVYVLGTINYDFGDEARLDVFRQSMGSVDCDGILLAPDPLDPRQMVEHLDRYPDQATDLIWILELDGVPLYSLDPKVPFGLATYEIFIQMLKGQLSPQGNEAFVDHVSIPGRRTSRFVELLSGEKVPVLHIPSPRGLYGWNVSALVQSAISTVNSPRVDLRVVADALASFLHLVYSELRNLGQASRDRALNFAVTNIFQAAATFAEALGGQRELEGIAVEKSPYCRLNSDCWDVELTFHDPDNSRRSRQVYVFTLDVSDLLPVTVGQIKRWAVPVKNVLKA